MASPPSQRLGALAVGAVLAALLMSGCSGSTTGMQSGLVNSPNSFSYGGQLSRDATDSMTWVNDHPAAQVSWGGQVASGSFTLTMHDSAGHQVYSKTYGTGQSGANEQTSSGMSGDWTITMAFNNFSGQMGLSITGSG
jgi:hypothetical protein